MAASLTRYFEVTNPDGSTSIQTLTGHQHELMDTPDNGVELTEQQGLAALRRDELARHRRERDRARAEADAILQIYARQV